MTDRPFELGSDLAKALMIFLMLLVLLAAGSQVKIPACAGGTFFDCLDLLFKAREAGALPQAQQPDTATGGG